VQAKSAGLGQGSEFIVTLPLTAAPALESSADGDQVIAASTPSGCRIMVVDDNCDAANSLAMLLRTLGHQVKVAHSGSDALAMVESFAPAIMFLDIGMPEMDGYEVARRLRADPTNTGLCLAALTGWGQVEDRRKTAEAGFNHHIVKPPDMQAILRVVAEAQQPKELGL
jgi:CheY-like chemotaxis protein